MQAAVSLFARRCGPRVRRDHKPLPATRSDRGSLRRFVLLGVVCPERGLLRHIKEIKKDLYLDLVPRINSGKIELLDDHALVTQLLALERKPTTSSRESIDHPRGQLDDLANAVAGVATMTREPAKIFF